MDQCPPSLHRAPGGPRGRGRQVSLGWRQSWTGLLLLSWHVPDAQWGGPLAAHGCQRPRHHGSGRLGANAREQSFQKNFNYCKNNVCGEDS